MISYQRNLMSFTFLILANLLTFIRGQPQTFCPNNGNYTNNTTYQANLNNLTATLSTNIDNYGFYNASLGLNSDTVYAYALCRGDYQLDLCRSCVQNASSDLIQACPNYRQGIIWSEFCMLRYSNVTLYGTMDTSVYIGMLNTQNNITNLGRFLFDLGTLLGDISRQASNGGSLRKVAALNRNTSDLTIYGMVQCTPDLSRDDCYACLSVVIENLHRVIIANDVPRGARLLMPNCNIRYEIGPFYNQTRLQELETSSLIPPTPSQQPAVNGDNNNSTRTITIIVVPLVAGLIIIFFIGFFIMRMKKKLQEATQDELAPYLLEGNAAEDISIFESLQYDFRIFKAATNDFSEANKLGQGGFGAVYKGTLPNGQEVAVKRLSIGSNQGDLEFKNEVKLLVKLQHRNLVRLLGYSREGTEKLLVYEFVQNASLDAFIFDTTKRSILDWDKRYKIIGGIARGILYLHEDSRLTIIHRDLKAGNVLLDGNMNPKIADFGTARLFVPDETQGSTNRIVGT